MRQRAAGLHILDFDVRGTLYATAIELAPHARDEEADTLMRWMNLEGDERCADIAAGTGLLTGKIAAQTTGEVYAIDPSFEQLSALQRLYPSVHSVLGSPDDPKVFNVIPPGSMNVVTSQGGIHHVHDQRAMFENIVKLLKTGGRCVCADACAGTSVAHHFDEYVDKNCLTGHDAIWLDEARITHLIDGLPLRLVRTERKDLSWAFSSREEMALFFKGLHAYDLPEETVLADLDEALGIFQKNGMHHVNWNLLYFHLEKTA